MAWVAGLGSAARAGARAGRSAGSGERFNATKAFDKLFTSAAEESSTACFESA